MPIHSIATYLSAAPATPILIIVVCLATILVLKSWSNGRVNTWERDWGGKMILVLVSVFGRLACINTGSFPNQSLDVRKAEPSSITLQLLHYLSHLPHPPQILYLPPIPSPLPEYLLTILHTIRLSASSAGPTTGELSCEPLPTTPEAVRDFVRKWIVPVPGTGEGGRRIDAIVWGDGWEVKRPLSFFADGSKVRKESKASMKQSTDSNTSTWTSEQSQFHFITAILPCLLKQPMERSIRLINVVSPFYSAAIPSLPTVNSMPLTTTILKTTPTESPILSSGKSSLRSILFFSHLQQVLNALASVEQAKIGAVPVPNAEEAEAATTNTSEAATTTTSEALGQGEDLRRRRGGGAKDIEAKVSF